MIDAADWTRFLRDTEPGRASYWLKKHQKHVAIVQKPRHCPRAFFYWEPISNGWCREARQLPQPCRDSEPITARCRVLRERYDSFQYGSSGDWKNSPETMPCSRSIGDRSSDLNQTVFFYGAGAAGTGTTGAGSRRAARGTKPGDGTLGKQRCVKT